MWNYNQQQSMLNKQKVEQKIDLEYNIDFMGRALSKAEIYAFRFGNQNKIKNFQPLFGFYNRFNSGYETNKEGLFKALINAVKFVDYGFKETKDKYGEILFPNNMSKEEVIQYIQQLRSCLNDSQERSIYTKLIRLINDSPTNFNKYNNLYDNDARMNPKKMMDSYPFINKSIEQREINWMENIERNPNYQPGFQLGQNFDVDQNFADYNRRRNKYNDFK
jgi:hypothetical protein